MQKRKKAIRQKKVRYLTPRNNGIISNSITQNWTEQALRCYRNNCNCEKCSIKSANYSFVCQMPKVLKILLKELGPPEQDKIDKMLA